MPILVRDLIGHLARCGENARVVIEGDHDEWNDFDIRCLAPSSEIRFVLNDGTDKPLCDEDKVVTDAEDAMCQLEARADSCDFNDKEMEELVIIMRSKLNELCGKIPSA